MGPADNRLEGPPYDQIQVQPSMLWQWIRADEPFISSNMIRPFMMHADMAIIRDFDAGGIHHILGDGRVDCTIQDGITKVNRCPAAETLAQAGLYSDDNTLWLTDFRKVLITLIQKGLQ